MNKNRTVVLTGAGGTIGRTLIEHILVRTRWRILAFSSSLEGKADWGDRVVVYTNDEINTILTVVENVDTCVHLAFSRRFKTNSEIASSLDFSLSVFKAALACGCRLINLSTVGVYGLNSSFPDENTSPAPDSLYAMAKYASEVLLRSVFMGEEREFTNLRLSGVVQSQRVVPVFIENAKTHGEIRITGGKQQFSWIDIDDAVDGIIAMIAYEGRWKPIYNVALNKTRYLITDIAKIVADVSELKGFGKTVISVMPSDESSICVGWDSQSFIDHTGWVPKFTIRDTILKMF